MTNVLHPTNGHHPTLAAQMLRVGYQTGPVLDALSPDVQRGQITALVGPNGSGKSTLTACPSW